MILTTATGERFLPILPARAAIPEPVDQTRLIQLGETSIVAGRLYSVAGGEGTYSLAATPPASCPRRQFLIGGIRQ